MVAVVVITRLPVRPRVALYSHDAQGLGHVRRNLAIAGVVADGGRRDVLLVTGAKEAGVFATPPGVELLTLPALGKAADGTYAPRALAVGLPALIELRSQTIAAALDAFAPDVLIVDKLPLGVEDELVLALDVLAAHHGTRLVLGLREILDDPATTRREWAACDAEAAMRDRYHAIWVYGDPAIYDAAVEYGLDATIAAKLRFTGYLGRDPGVAEDGRGTPRHVGVPAGRLALCLVGGGQDGFALAAAFARAPLPAGTTGLVVTGPFMPPADRIALDRLVAARRDVRLLSFVDDPGPLVARADLVVTMGGYNTVCELLHLGRRTLVVPRVAPRVEQLIRAERLSRAGVLDHLHPADLTPQALGAWLAAPDPGRPHPTEVIDLAGLQRLPALLGELLPATRAPRSLRAAVRA